MPFQLSIWTVWSAGFVVLFWLWAGRHGRDLCHPIRLVGSLWFGCLLLASLRLLPTLSAWGAEFWLQLTLPLVAFGLGFKLVESFLRRKYAHTGERGLRLARFRPATILCVAGACVLIGVVALAWLYQEIGVIPILAPNIDRARTAFFGVGANLTVNRYNTIGNKLIFILVGFLCYGIYLAWLVVVLRIEKSRGQLLLAWAIVGLGAAAYWSQGGRVFVFNTCIVLLLLYNYLRAPIKVRQAATFLAVLVVVLALAAFYRGSSSHDIGDETTALLSSHLGTEQAARVFTSGYWTLTSSFEVYYRLRHDVQQIGAHPGFLFYAFHSIIPRTNIQAVCQDLYSGATITPTFLGEFYGDYGVAGTLLGPLLLGGATAWFYAYFTATESVGGALALALWLNWLALIPYVNFFSEYFTWIIDLLALWGLTRLIASETAPQAWSARQVLYR